MKVGRGLAEKHWMWTLLSARDDTAHPREHQEKRCQVAPTGPSHGTRILCLGDEGGACESVTGPSLEGSEVVFLLVVTSWEMYGHREH